MGRVPGLFPVITLFKVYPPGLIPAAQPVALLWAAGRVWRDERPRVRGPLWARQGGDADDMT